MGPQPPDLESPILAEKESAAIMVHVTGETPGYDIAKNGFVNVSGRGTLAPITDNPYPDEGVGVPSIVMSQTQKHSDGPMIITFRLPTNSLRPDAEGKYGMWFDNRLPRGQHPELWDVYNKIVTKYNDKTGEPVKFAKDDPRLYPVFIPPEYILGVATRSK